MTNAGGLSFKTDMLEKYVSTETGTHIEWDLDVPWALVSFDWIREFAMYP